MAERKLQYIIEMIADDKKLRQQMSGWDWKKIVGLGDADIISKALTTDANNAKAELGKVFNGLNIDWSKILGTKEMAQMEQALARALQNQRDVVKGLAAQGDTKGIENLIGFVSQLGTEFKTLGSGFDVSQLARSFNSFMKVLTSINVETDGILNVFNKLSHINKTDGIVAVSQGFTVVGDEISKASVEANKGIENLKKSLSSIDVLFNKNYSIKFAKNLEEQFYNTFDTIDKVENRIGKLTERLENTKTSDKDFVSIRNELAQAYTIRAGLYRSLELIDQEHISKTSKDKSLLTLNEVNPSTIINESKREIQILLENAKTELNEILKSTKTTKDGINIPIKLPTQADLIKVINKYVDSINSTKAIHGIKLNVGNSANVIEDKATRAYKDNQGDDDANTTALVAKTESRFDRIAETIDSKQQKILDKTQTWRNNMLNQLKFKNGDFEFNFGDSLFESLQDYLTRQGNELKFIVDQETIKKQLKTIIETSGFTLGGVSGTATIDPNAIAHAVYEGMQAAVNGTVPPSFNSSGHTTETSGSDAESTEKLADETAKMVDNSDKYIKTITEKTINSERVIEALRKFAQASTKKGAGRQNVARWLTDRGIDIEAINKGASDEAIRSMLTKALMKQDRFGYVSGATVVDTLGDYQRFGVKSDAQQKDVAAVKTEIKEMLNRMGIDQEYWQESQKRAQSYTAYEMAAKYGRPIAALGDLRKPLKANAMKNFADGGYTRVTDTKYIEKLDDALAFLDKLPAGEFRDNAKAQITNFKDEILKLGENPSAEAIAGFEQVARNFFEQAGKIMQGLYRSYGDSKTFQGRVKLQNGREFDINSPYDFAKIRDDNEIANVDVYSDIAMHKWEKSKSVKKSIPQDFERSSYYVNRPAPPRDIENERVGNVEFTPIDAPKSSDLSGVINGLESSSRQLADKKQQIVNNISELDKIISSKGSEYAEISKAVNALTDAERKSLEKDVKTKQNVIADKNRKIEEEQKEINRVSGLISIEEDNVNNLQQLDVNAEFQKRKSELESRIQESYAQGERYKAELVPARQEYDTAQSNYDKIHKDYSDAQGQLKQLDALLNEKRTEVDEAKKIVDNLKREISDIDTQMNKKGVRKTTKDKLGVQKDLLTSELQNAQKTYDNLLLERSQYTEEVNKASANIHSLGLKDFEAKQNVNNTKQKVNSIQAMIDGSSQRRISAEQELSNLTMDAIQAEKDLAIQRRQDAISELKHRKKLAEGRLARAQQSELEASNALSNNVVFQQQEKGRELDALRGRKEELSVEKTSVDESIRETQQKKEKLELQNQYNQLKLQELILQREISQLEDGGAKRAKQAELDAVVSKLTEIETQASKLGMSMRWQPPKDYTDSDKKSDAFKQAVDIQNRLMIARAQQRAYQKEVEDIAKQEQNVRAGGLNSGEGRRWEMLLKSEARDYFRGTDLYKEEYDKQRAKINAPTGSEEEKRQWNELNTHMRNFVNEFINSITASAGKLMVTDPKYAGIWGNFLSQSRYTVSGKSEVDLKQMILDDLAKRKAIASGESDAGGKEKQEYIKGLPSLISSLEKQEQAALAYGGFTKEDLGNAELVEEIINKTASVEINRKKRDDLTTDLSNAIDELERAKKQNLDTTPFKSRVKDIKAKITQLDTLIDREEAYIENTKQQIELQQEEKTASRKSLTDRLTQAEDRLRTSKERLASVNNEIKTLEKEATDAETKYGADSAEAERARLNLLYKQRAKATLERNIGYDQKRVDRWSDRVYTENYMAKASSESTQVSSQGGIFSGVIAQMEAIASSMGGGTIDVDNSDIATETTLRAIFELLSGGGQASADLDEQKALAKEEREALRAEERARFISENQQASRQSAAESVEKRPSKTEIQKSKLNEEGQAKFDAITESVKETRKELNGLNTKQILSKIKTYVSSLKKMTAGTEEYLQEQYRLATAIYTYKGKLQESGVADKVSKKGNAYLSMDAVFQRDEISKLGDVKSLMVGNVAGLADGLIKLGFGKDGVGLGRNKKEENLMSLLVSNPSKVLEIAKIDPERVKKELFGAFENFSKATGTMPEHYKEELANLTSTDIAKVIIDTLAQRYEWFRKNAKPTAPNDTTLFGKRLLRLGEANDESTAGIMHTQIASLQNGLQGGLGRVFQTYQTLEQIVDTIYPNKVQKFDLKQVDVSSLQVYLQQIVRDLVEQVVYMFRQQSIDDIDVANGIKAVSDLNGDVKILRPALNSLMSLLGITDISPDEFFKKLMPPINPNEYVISNSKGRMGVDFDKLDATIDPYKQSIFDYLMKTYTVPGINAPFVMDGGVQPKEQTKTTESQKQLDIEQAKTEEVKNQLALLKETLKGIDGRASGEKQAEFYHGLSDEVKEAGFLLNSYDKSGMSKADVSLIGKFNKLKENADKYGVSETETTTRASVEQITNEFIDIFKESAKRLKLFVSDDYLTKLARKTAGDAYNKGVPSAKDYAPQAKIDEFLFNKVFSGYELLLSQSALARGEDGKWQTPMPRTDEGKAELWAVIPEQLKNAGRTISQHLDKASDASKEIYERMLKIAGGAARYENQTNVTDNDDDISQEDISQIVRRLEMLSNRIDNLNDGPEKEQLKSEYDQLSKMVNVTNNTQGKVLDEKIDTTSSNNNIVQSRSTSGGLLGIMQSELGVMQNELAKENTLSQVLIKLAEIAKSNAMSGKPNSAQDLLEQFRRMLERDMWQKRERVAYIDLNTGTISNEIVGDADGISQNQLQILRDAYMGKMDLGAQVHTHANQEDPYFSPTDLAQFSNDLNNNVLSLRQILLSNNGFTVLDMSEAKDVSGLLNALKGTEQNFEALAATAKNFGAKYIYQTFDSITPQGLVKMLGIKGIESKLSESETRDSARQSVIDEDAKESAEAMQKSTGRAIKTTFQRYGLELEKLVEETDVKGNKTWTSQIGNKVQKAMMQTRQEMFRALGVGEDNLTDKFGIGTKASASLADYTTKYNQLMDLVQKFNQSGADKPTIQKQIDALLPSFRNAEKELSLLIARTDKFMRLGEQVTVLNSGSISTEALTKIATKEFFGDNLLPGQNIATAGVQGTANGKQLLVDLLDNGAISRYALEVDETTGQVRKLLIAESDLANAFQNVNKAMRQNEIVQSNLGGLDIQNAEQLQAFLATAHSPELDAYNSSLKEMQQYTANLWNTMKSGTPASEEQLNYLMMLSERVIGLGKNLQKTSVDFKNFWAQNPDAISGLNITTRNADGSVIGNRNQIVSEQMQQFAQEQARARNAKYDFVSFDNDTLTYQLTDVEGNINRVTLAWNELYQKVATVNDKSVAALDPVVAKINQYAEAFQNAVASGYLHSGDANLQSFNAIQMAIQNIISSVKDGTATYAEQEAELERLRKKAVEYGETVNKIINHNKKLYVGTNEVNATTRQYDKLKGVYGFQKDIDNPQILNDYLIAYDNLIKKFEEYANAKSLNDPSKQAELKQEAAQVQLLGRMYNKAATEAQKLEEAVKNSEELGKIKYKGQDMMLGGVEARDKTAYSNLESQMRAYAQTMGHVNMENVKFNATKQQMTYTIRINKDEVADMVIKYNQARDAIFAYNTQQRESLSGLKLIGAEFKQKFRQILQYTASMTSIYRIFSMIRRCVQYVKEIDVALTELKKVTDETNDTYDKFLKTASKTAAKVGSTTKDVISSTADWARLK